MRIVPTNFKGIENYQKHELLNEKDKISHQTQKTCKRMAKNYGTRLIKKTMVMLARKVHPG